MISQQVVRFGVSELILLVIYAFFAYLGHRQKNFYQARRWKAAIWISIISAFLIVAVICFPVLLSTDKDFAETEISRFGPILATIVFTFAFVIPLMFIITITAYNRLAWSDDFLDKIWKDPNKEKRSPIQPF